MCKRECVCEKKGKEPKWRKKMECKERREGSCDGSGCGKHHKGGYTRITFR